MYMTPTARLLLCWFIAPGLLLSLNLWKYTSHQDETVASRCLCAVPFSPSWYVHITFVQSPQRKGNSLDWSRFWRDPWNARHNMASWGHSLKLLGCETLDGVVSLIYVLHSSFCISRWIRLQGDAFRALLVKSKLWLVQRDRVVRALDLKSVCRGFKSCSDR